MEAGTYKVYLLLGKEGDFVTICQQNLIVLLTKFCCYSVIFIVICLSSTWPSQARPK